MPWVYHHFSLKVPIWGGYTPFSYAPKESYCRWYIHTISIWYPYYISKQFISSMRFQEKHVIHGVRGVLPTCRSRFLRGSGPVGIPWEHCGHMLRMLWNTQFQDFLFFLGENVENMWNWPYTRNSKTSPSLVVVLSASGFQPLFAWFAWFAWSSASSSSLLLQLWLHII